MTQKSSEKRVIGDPRLLVVREQVIACAHVGFHPIEKMTIVKPKAVNSHLGNETYTFPDLSQAMPTGLQGTGLLEADLSQPFGTHLVLMLGALENGDQAVGTLLHTPHIDQSQGLGRLARGLRFCEHARDDAERIEAAFHWQIQVIDGIEHTY